MDFLWATSPFLIPFRARNSKKGLDPKKIILCKSSLTTTKTRRQGDSMVQFKPILKTNTLIICEKDMHVIVIDVFKKIRTMAVKH